LKINNSPINKITLDSHGYPKRLRELPDPPQQLYFRGSWDPGLFEKSLAVVGSRRMTHYGERVLETLIPHLVATNITIISGFMYGVDSEAHHQALECGGKTVAVLGGGLNVLYPPENEKLYTKIISQSGLIISEYPPDQQPQLWTFVQRNRIIAGLASLGVLIVEAGEKSGSLVTAKIARQQKKLVFAVPGPITSSVSKGTNKLIADGLAKMVLSGNDIVLQESPAPQDQTLQGCTPIEQKILELLKNEPLTLDEISQKTASNIIEVGQTLTMMALKGQIEEKNGKYYWKFTVTV